MNRRQYTIMGLLVAAAGLHIWLDPTAKSSFKTFLTITPNNWKTVGSAQISIYLFWFIGLASLLLLSDFAPRVALMIAVLILTGAVLVNNDPIATWINNTVANMSNVQPTPPVQEGSAPA